MSARWPAPSRPDHLQESGAFKPQLELVAYRDQAITAAKTSGMKRAGTTDPEGLARVLETISDLAAEGWEFTSDDVVARTGPGYGAVMGSAFHALAKAGRIESVGFTTSRRVQRKGSVIRTWRGAT
jgi:hypothetical protein